MVFLFPALFVFHIALLTHFVFYGDMAESKDKFIKVARTAHKGKAIAGTSSPPPRRACRAKEIIILPPPPSPPLATEESTPI